jgi:hypothetical protein
MGQMYQCWWRICREINVFPSRFEYHIFYVLYPFVTYLLALPCISQDNQPPDPRMNPRSTESEGDAEIRNFHGLQVSHCGRLLVRPCCLTDGCHRLGEPAPLIFRVDQSSSLNTEATGFCSIMAIIYETTLSYNRENHNLVPE